jgi:hypothetical protein
MMNHQKELKQKRIVIKNKLINSIYKIIVVKIIYSLIHYIKEVVIVKY